MIIRACRLRRRSPAASPRPQAVCSQSCKKSFLRSLFCSSEHIGLRPCGLSAYVLTPGEGKGFLFCKRNGATQLKILTNSKGKNSILFEQKHILKEMTKGVVEISGLLFNLFNYFIINQLL